MDIEQMLGIKLSVLLAGVVGGIVSLTYEEQMSVKKAVCLILGGASTAAYLQPLAIHYVGIPDNLSVGLGFVLGLLSMKIIDFLMKRSGSWLSKFFMTDDATRIITRTVKRTKRDDSDN